MNNTDDTPKQKIDGHKIHRKTFDLMMKTATEANAGFHAITHKNSEDDSEFLDVLEILMRQYKISGVMAVMPNADQCEPNGARIYGMIYQIVRQSADNPKETPVLCQTFADKRVAEQWIEDHPSLSYVFKISPCLVYDD